MTDLKPIRVGIVGCGAFSELFYAPLLSSFQDDGQVEVVSLFDPDEKRLGELAKKFPKAVCSPDISVVKSAGIDFAIVASPPRFHAEQTISLLNEGVAVLCEKPMAATVAEAEEMIAAAKQTNTLLAVGLFRRFFATTQLVKEIVFNERLGKVKEFKVFEGGIFNWPAQSASFFQKSGSNGGVLADLGVHVLDVLIYWFGMPTSFRYEDDAMGGLEANSFIELEFENDIKGTVRLSRDTNLPNRTIIECEQGWLRCGAASADQLEIGFPGSELSVAGEIKNIGKNGPDSYRSRSAASFSMAFAEQLRNVLAAVRKDGELLIDGEQGVLSMRLIEQCYSSRNLMSMPWLGQSEMSSTEKFFAKSV